MARIRTGADTWDRPGLRRIEDVAAQVRATIHDHHIRCFSAMPDFDMVEVGLECHAVLTHLGDAIAQSPPGTVVHLVVDDPTAYPEMVRWTDQTKNELIDWRREAELYHFIVRKAR